MLQPVQGKTETILHVMKPALIQRYKKKGVWLTASTGRMALKLDKGVATLHSQAILHSQAALLCNVATPLPNFKAVRPVDAELA